MAYSGSKAVRKRCQRAIRSRAQVSRASETRVSRQFYTVLKHAVPGQYDAKDGPPRPTSKYGMIGPLSHKVSANKGYSVECCFQIRWILFDQVLACGLQDRREGLQPGQGMTPRPITSRLSLNSTLSSKAQAHPPNSGLESPINERLH